MTAKETVAPQRLWRIPHSGVLIVLGISLLFVAAQWALLFWQLPPTDQTVFLHYNVFFGIDLTGAWNQLLWLPGTGTGLLIINGLLISMQRHLNTAHHAVISAATLILEAMMLAGLFLVVLLNIA